MSSWFEIHPKVKALGIAVLLLVAESVPAALNGTVTWHDVLIADVTAGVALVVAYFKGVPAPVAPVVLAPDGKDGTSNAVAPVVAVTA